MPVLPTIFHIILNSLSSIKFKSKSTELGPVWDPGDTMVDSLYAVLIQWFG